MVRYCYIFLIDINLEIRGWLLAANKSIYWLGWAQPMVTVRVLAESGLAFAWHSPGELWLDPGKPGLHNTILENDKYITLFTTHSHVLNKGHSFQMMTLS